jgi:hypothetical protein
MSSPDLRKRGEFDLTIGHELQSWAGRHHAPADTRRRVMEGAAELERKRRPPSGLRSSSAVLRIRQLLHIGPARRKPQLPYSELSQWLFNQAMWHSLGNDRRSVRFVC